MKIFNETGQSLIETCLGLTALVFATGLIGASVQSYVLFKTLSHFAYEELICESSSTTASLCRQELSQQLKNILGPESDVRLDWIQTTTERRLNLQVPLVQVPFFKPVQIRIIETLPLRLL